MVQGIASFMDGSTKEQQLRQQSKEELLNNKTPIQKRRERRAGLKGGEGGTGGIGKFATQLTLGALPGTGVGDVIGVFPDVEGGYEPSMLVNLQQAKRSYQEGNYKQAAIQGIFGALQGLGGAGDVAFAAAPFAPLALPVAVGAKTVSGVGKKLIQKFKPREINLQEIGDKINKQKQRGLSATVGLSDMKGDYVVRGREMNDVRYSDYKLEETEADKIMQEERAKHKSLTDAKGFPKKSVSANKFNVGSFDGITMFTTNVVLKPQELRGIKGYQGEEKRLKTPTGKDSKKLKNLKDSIAKEGYKPYTNPQIVVNHKGEPFVLEGNHRIQEAIDSGRPTIAVDIKYLTTGYRADGPLNPQKLIDENPLTEADLVQHQKLYDEFNFAGKKMQAKEQARYEKEKGIASLPTEQGATKVENMLKPKTEIRSEGGFKFAPEKIKQNVQLQKVRIAKMNEGKTPAGEPLNERIEIKAPKGSNLPNFVVGKIKPKDWQERTEKLLSDEEIEQASNWYNEVYDYFKKAPYTKDDEEAKQLARAWFASQQNKSPAQGVAHVLSIRNLLREGKSPEEILAMEKIPAGGLEGANKAILSVLTGREVEGVGSKISDFRDALDGKNVRSFMGNDTIGGQPFVVDVHTGRDTGLVDKPLLNVLEAKGYTIPKNIKLDFGKKQEGLQGGGVPSGQYENRSVFGNELTEYLNSVNWKGKNDWEPAQIQAIGWTALTNFYGGVNTAGNIKDALNLNVQRISMEVAPGDGSPWAKMFGEDFSKLSVDNQSKINKDVTDEAIKKISEAENVDLYNNVFGTGGWQTFVNPSTVQEILGSKDQAVRIASKLGYVLNQTEMYVNATKKLTSDPEAYAFDIVEVGSEKLKDSKYVNELFSKIYEKTNGVVVGFHPLLTVDKEPAIRMIVGPEKIKKFYEDNKLAKSRKENQLKKNNFFENDLKEQIKSVILGEDADYGLVLREADLTVLKNEWNKKGQQNGQNYVRHFSKGRQSGTKDDGFRVLDNIRQELTDFFRQKIRDAQGVKTPNEEVVEIIEDPPPINKKAFGGFVESSNYDHYRII
jgi:hypothetical protein